jgi:hypothetical protein
LDGVIERLKGIRGRSCPRQELAGKPSPNPMRIRERSSDTSRANRNHISELRSHSSTVVREGGCCIKKGNMINKVYKNEKYFHNFLDMKKRLT